MPALDKLRQQHDVLCAPRNEAPGLRLAAAFAEAAAPLRAAGLLPNGLADALERDLLYVLLRHLPWSAAPLFADVVVDALATEHALERPVASALTHALLPQARRLAQSTLPSHVEPTDEEFLRYVCVATATAESEAALVLDLGFGTGLLARIKEAVRLMVQADETAVRFLPEIDAQIVEIMLDLAREQQTVPWALQVHRLRFLLRGIGEPWRTLLAGHGARWAFDALLALAVRGSASERQLSTRLAQVLPAGAAVGPLLAALAPFGLCYAERDRWQALPLAQELTAEAWARNRLNTPKSPWTDLADQCPAFQAALVRCAPDVEEAQLMSLLTKRPLAPSVLTAATARLAEVAGAARAADTVAGILQDESSPWLRKAACDALASLTSDGAPLPVGQTLVEVARSDPSTAVQSAALRAALRHGATARQAEDAGGGATAGRADAPPRSNEREPGR